MQNDIAAMAIDATEQLTLIAERLLQLSCSHGSSERLEQPAPTVRIEYSRFQAAAERESAPLFQGTGLKWLVATKYAEAIFS
jgi:hypothetical protein